MKKVLTDAKVQKVISEVFGTAELESIYLSEDCSIKNKDGLFIVNDKEFYLDFEDEYLIDDEYWYATCGASKIVLSCSLYDMVIKIPITGIFSENAYDECIDYCVNYIYSEVEIYNDSSDNIKEILLQNSFITCCGDLEIYVQPKVEHNFYEAYPPSSVYGDAKLIDKVNEILSTSNAQYHGLPCNFFLADILKYFGEERGLEIIEEIDFDDMNNNNYGYLRDGKPVIFDYAGFDY